MSRIVHLPSGSAIKLDVIESFDRAVQNPENLNEYNDINWDFVSADMSMDLGGVYNFDYLDECLETLADQYELDVADDRLQVLKKDFLGMGE